MIAQKKIQKTMLSLLEEYTGCPAVPANTTKKMTAYPYISFSVINTDTKKGTYSVYGNTKAMPLNLKYSFTVQSDDDAEALMIAMQVKDFFEEAKRLELADNDIIVADVGAITPRDNMITIEYEYRKGLDVTLRLVNVISDTNEDTIDAATLTSNAGIIKLEKE